MAIAMQGCDGCHVFVMAIAAFAKAVTIIALVISSTVEIDGNPALVVIAGFGSTSSICFVARLLYAPRF